MSRVFAFVVVLSVANVAPAWAYSVLAHQSAIDAAWEPSIRPLLLRRFPAASTEDLLRARSFAYGGSAVQDLGYYPFGNKFFSNLLHYVRSGDFVEILLEEARTIDEYAFALGALAHYATDNIGHPEAVNRAVPLAFPKLGREFGNAVTYLDAPKQHIVVEFSFDIVHVAGERYLPGSYNSFIGFNVAAPLLERAFRETYGLEMRDLLGDQERAIATYRYAVSQIIPALTAAAWRDKRDDILRLNPGIDKRRFVFTYGRRDFEREYGRDYDKPGCFARFLGWLYRVLPKIGPLAPLRFKAPTAEAETLFAASFQHATARFRAALKDVAAGRLDLRNTVFDTGRPARHGEYALADDTYLQLLREISNRGYRLAPAALRRNIRAFYGTAARASTKDERKHWPAVQEALAALDD